VSHNDISSRTSEHKQNACRAGSAVCTEAERREREHSTCPPVNSSTGKKARDVRLISLPDNSTHMHCLSDAMTIASKMHCTVNQGPLHSILLAQCSCSVVQRIAPAGSKADDPLLVTSKSCRFGMMLMHSHRLVTLCSCTNSLKTGISMHCYATGLIATGLMEMQHGDAASRDRHTVLQRSMRISTQGIAVQEGPKT
jgi:hypothetical protein